MDTVQNNVHEIRVGQWGNMNPTAVEELVEAGDEEDDDTPEQDDESTPQVGSETSKVIPNHI